MYRNIRSSTHLVDTNSDLQPPPPSIHFPSDALFFFLDLGEVNALRVAVAQQTLLAHLATQPAVLEPGEVGILVGYLERVDEDGAGLEPAREALGARNVLGVDGGGEARVVQVRAAEDVVLVAPLEDGNYGAYVMYGQSLDDRVGWVCSTGDSG